MSVAVLGGSGFIGTRLCNRLNESGVFFTIHDKVFSHTFPNHYHKADVCSLSDLISSIPENAIIVNLAAEHKDDVRPLNLYHEVNIGGAKNVCDLARSKNINKIVFTSSVAVYGFAKLGTDESGKIAPFNEYGKTKWEAEQVYIKWHSEDPERRTLVIVRPTVIFGERNRGNVFSLLRHIESGKFVMVGDGLNRKSMAYVENIAAFLQYSLDFKPGVHIYNYVDKPDFSMNQLVTYVNTLLGRSNKFKLRLPFSIGLLIGYCFDLVAIISKKKFPISSIRIKKFCANSVYESAIELTGFIPPVPIMSAIEKTIRFEFDENHSSEHVFYSE